MFSSATSCYHSPEMMSLSASIDVVRLSLMLILVTCTITSSSSPTDRPRNKVPQAKIRIAQNWFIDEFDRVLLFRGVNAVTKEFPWYPDYLLNDTRIDDLVKSGFNVVRLGSMWSGVEPQDGVFNETYINTLHNIVTRLSQRGIYTILDMHQDVMSSIYKSYDGIPKWLVETFPEPEHQYPWPLKQVNNWAEGYLTQACSEGFQFLYNNTNHALDKWIRFWTVLSERIGRDDPAVLGYEWINEPWAGDYFKQPSLITPGVSGSANLMPCYDRINEAVRRIDPVTIQFYEPITLGVAFDSTHEFLGNGFDRVPGGPQYKDVSAYAYHIYCWHMELLGGGGTEEERLEAVRKCKNRLLPRVFKAQNDDIKRTGGASFLTEFGLCRTDGDPNQETNIDCEVFLNLADKWLQSWTDWDYQCCWYLPDGRPNLGRQKAYSRPYARATAGTPLSMSFDASKSIFKFTYRPNRSISTDAAPTEIYIPSSFHYPSGFKVDISPNGIIFHSDADSIAVTHEGLHGDSFPDVITIIVSPVTQ